MTSHSLALLGFGNVGRALAGLLQQKRGELQLRYGIEWKITGVASRRLGWLADPAGLDVSSLLAGAVPAPNLHRSSLHYGGVSKSPISNYQDWLSASHATVLFENTSLDPQAGQPALDYIRAALGRGTHVVTANKGPLVHGYHELRDLAARNHVRFLFEATVMGGAPIFSLFREALPAVELRRFRGILNSTTNLMLSEMEAGLTFEQAVKSAQDLGIAETDPSADVDGWDAAVKVSALATVLMDVRLSPQQVQRVGIRDLSPRAVQAARAEGRPYKLVCQAERGAAGQVSASVLPQQIALDDPLASVRGASSIITFELDTLHGLTLKEEEPNAATTAYGPFADFITIAS
jgi:homoserine dehydrogenase